MKTPPVRRSYRQDRLKAGEHLNAALRIAMARTPDPRPVLTEIRAAMALLGIPEVGSS